MIISISGTPGTGKTSVARELAKIMKAKVISTKQIASEKKAFSGFDKKRNVPVVDVKKLNKSTRAVPKNENVILEGHLSHYLDADLTIILRCRPDVLEKRMKSRKWPKNKIRENVQAEILDTTTIEAIDFHGRKKIVEMDATAKKPKQLAGDIKNVLNNLRLRSKYLPGKIDWTEKFGIYLIKNK